MPPIISPQDDDWERSEETIIFIHTDGLMNQKHSPDQVPCDTSSVQSFCTHFKDIISQGNCLLTLQNMLAVFPTFAFLGNTVIQRHFEWHNNIHVMCSCHNMELLFQLAWCNHTSQNVPQNLKNNFVGYASCHNLQSFVSHHTRGGCCIGDCPTGACPIGDGWPMTDCPCIGDGCCCAGYGMCDKPCCWGGGLYGLYLCGCCGCWG